MKTIGAKEKDLIGGKRKGGIVGVEGRIREKDWRRIGGEEKVMGR